MISMDLKEKIRILRVPPQECGELTDHTVFINRVAKVVKGGRRFSFSALIVSGDGQGHVGFGMGKAGEVPEAIRKGSERAHGNMVAIPMRGTTIPHDVHATFGPTKVVIKAAPPGTGVIAGSAMRAVANAIGIADVRMKCIGSNNPQNVVQATLMALLSLKQPDQIASMRGISLEELGYSPF
jgi:small subunit ribosomal protein S5